MPPPNTDAMIASSNYDHARANYTYRHGHDLLALLLHLHLHRRRLRYRLLLCKFLLTLPLVSVLDHRGEEIFADSYTGFP
jgi:hypothetical protein